MFEKYQDGLYVLAISGGSDSMALLAMAVKSHLKIVVCHVNYHRRATSGYDEQVVRAFCDFHQISCYVKHAGETYSGNFQEYARKFRYAFFEEIYHQTKAIGLMTAHHQDDVLETALMRQQQNRVSDFIGIKQETIVMTMRVIRPLLSFFKEDLLDYCMKHQITFAMDESNLEETYTRNKIRHQQLKQYSKEEKLQLKKEIEEQNEILLLEQIACDSVIHALQYRDVLPIDLLMNHKGSSMLLRRWLEKQYLQTHQLSHKLIDEIVKLCQGNTGQKRIRLDEDYELLKQYDVLMFQKIKIVETFHYQLSEIKELSTPWFKMELTGNLRNGITLTDSDFPLTIRSYLPGDAIRFAFGRKKLSRYFIDQKIPMKDRKHWPVVLNSSHEIIFVCELGSNSEYFSNTPNLFVVK